LESELDSNESEHTRSHQKWNYPSAYSFLLLLPTSCCSRRFLPSPKRALIILCLLPFVFAIMVVAYGGIPPSFSGIKTYEHSLVQHDWSVQPKSSGDYEEKYLSFPDHLWGHGFNNILQEMYVSSLCPMNTRFISHHSLLTSYIAYATNRSFVFDDYVWSHLPLPYTLYDFALRPTRIPLNAFVAGPSAGGDVPSSMHRAISKRYFDYICPPSARVAITYSSSFVGQDANGLDIVNWWRERLNQDDVRNVSCLEIREVESRIFDEQSVLFTSKQASFY